MNVLLDFNRNSTHEENVKNFRRDDSVGPIVSKDPFTVCDVMGRRIGEKEDK